MTKDGGYKRKGDGDGDGDGDKKVHINHLVCEGENVYTLYFWSDMRLDCYQSSYCTINWFRFHMRLLGRTKLKSVRSISFSFLEGTQLLFTN